jgi:cytochrome c553
MHSFRSILAVLLLCFNGSAFSQATLETPNEAVTGEELFVACTFCHGSSVQGNDRRDGPALAGLDIWYLELQMHNYKNGFRGYLTADVPGQVMHFSAPIAMIGQDVMAEEVSGPRTVLFTDVMIDGL